MMFHYSLGAKTADAFKELFTHVDTFCRCKSPEAASKKKHVYRNLPHAVLLSVA